MMDTIRRLLEVIKGPVLLPLPSRDPDDEILIRALDRGRAERKLLRLLWSPARAGDVGCRELTGDTIVPHCRVGKADVCCYGSGFHGDPTVSVSRDGYHETFRTTERVRRVAKRRARIENVWV